jgi:hypothetical protein
MSTCFEEAHLQCLMPSMDPSEHLRHLEDARITATKEGGEPWKAKVRHDIQSWYYTGKFDEGKEEVERERKRQRESVEEEGRGGGGRRRRRGRRKERRKKKEGREELFFESLTSVLPDLRLNIYRFSINANHC